MEQHTHDTIAYIVCCVGAFAERHNISNPAAHAYLRKHKAIDFLTDCYAAEHTLPIDDAVDDMAAICIRNGGV